MVKDININKNINIKPSQIKQNKTKSKNKNKFDKLLKNKIELTKHATQQIDHRNIKINKNTLEKLNEALNKLTQKGAEESLVLTEDKAFIMNVKDRKVITAMKENNLKEKVFTNIDSAIIV